MFLGSSGYWISQQEYPSLGIGAPAIKKRNRIVCQSAAARKRDRHGPAFLKPTERIAHCILNARDARDVLGPLLGLYNNWTQNETVQEGLEVPGPQSVTPSDMIPDGMSWGMTWLWHVLRK